MKPEIKVEVYYYKTNCGTFFTFKNQYMVDNTYGFDGKPLKDYWVKTLGLDKWHKIDKLPNTIQRTYVDKVELIGYELKIKELKSERTPEFIPSKDVPYTYDDDDEIQYEGKYADVIILYSPVYTEPKTKIEDVKLNKNCLGEFNIDNWQMPEKMVVKEIGDYKGTRDDDVSTIASFSDIERLMTPEFMMHTRPCSITSKQMYSIVRAHILDNYDRKNSVVTSNYDFCFAVDKIAPKKHGFTKTLSGLELPKTKKVALKKPKEQQVRLPAFSMTYAGAGKNNVSGYEEYPVIESVSGNNLLDLQTKIKKYLDSLLEYINTPVCVCETCGGFGYTEPTA